MAMYGMPRKCKKQQNISILDCFGAFYTKLNLIFCPITCTSSVTDSQTA
jgi:hypothetical protein